MHRSRIRPILLTVGFGFLALTAWLAAWSYFRSLAVAEQGSLMRLRGIANAVALQIDGDAHEVLMQKWPTKDGIVFSAQDSIYQKIHAVLARNAAANMLKTPIYTVIMDSVEHHYSFGVTSAERPYFRHLYASRPAAMMEMYDDGAAVPKYSDEFGTWLSAFAPIKNRAGKTVALVQADEPFDAFLAKNRTDLLKNLAFALLIGFGLWFVVWRILQPILRREQRDKLALAEANDQISRLDGFRKEMLANVSHDLRTPMASILGFAETLLQKKDALAPAEKEKYLQIIAADARRMSRMIAELFELSKLESGQIALEREPLNFAELAQDLLFSVAEKAENGKIRLLTDFQEPLPLVEADVFWMNRVLQNLLENALKHAGEGGFIKFTVFSDAEKSVNVKVCNSGPCIVAEDLPHVFERFFRSSNRSKDSTGLGLAIVKKAVELHGGRVWAESADGVTTFRFLLSAA